MKIRLTPAAIRDLREVHSYISADDPSAAIRVVARLEKSIEMIGTRPQIGRTTGDLAVREWSVPGLPYVIPYRMAGEMVEILRIYHTRRLKPPSWQ